MKKFLYIMYIGFIVGAARRFSKKLRMGIGMRLRDTYYPPREYKVSLSYIIETKSPPGSDGHQFQMAVSIISGLSRTFVCKRAYGFFDVTLILRERMNRYIMRHYGKLDIGFNFESDCMADLMDPLGTSNLVNIEGYDVACINRAFAAMPREL